MAHLLLSQYYNGLHSLSYEKCWRCHNLSTYKNITLHMNQSKGNKYKNISTHEGCIFVLAIYAFILQCKYIETIRAQ